MSSYGGEGKKKQAWLYTGRVQILCQGVKVTAHSEARLNPAFLSSSQSLLHAACPEGCNFLGHEGSLQLNNPCRHDLWGIWGSVSFLGSPQPHISVYHTRSWKWIFTFCPLDSQSMIIDIFTWERWSKYEQKLPKTCELTYFYSMSVALTFFLTLIMVLFTRI